jgi:hypothetical protein
MRLVQAGQPVVCHFSVFAADGISHLPGQGGLCVSTLWIDGGISAVPVTITESGQGYYASFTPTSGNWHLEVHDPNDTLWGADIQAGPYSDVYCHFSVFAPDGYTKVSGQVGACSSNLWEDGAVSAVPVTLSEIGVSGEYYAKFTVGVSDLYHVEVTCTYDDNLWEDDIEPNIGFGGGGILPLTGIVEMVEVSGEVTEEAVEGEVATMDITGEVAEEEVVGAVETEDIEGGID